MTPQTGHIAAHAVAHPRGRRRGDGDIAHDAAEAMVSSTVLRIGDVRVTIHDGRVILHGTVPSSHERDEAARLVSKIGGVTSVHNALTLRPVVGSAAQGAPDSSSARP